MTPSNTSFTNRFSVRAIIVTILALTASFHLSAYTSNGWKWNRSQVDYYVNPANLDVPADVAIASVRAGATAWEAQSSSPFNFFYVGTTTGTTVTNNGRNEVFFRNGSNGAAIATTFHWSSGGIGIDADIVFWDATYKFVGGSTGCTNGFYIQDVATHEFGHALGLGHSLISEATMASGTPYCSTAKRSLASDDIQALEYLYPPLASANQPPVVTIVTPLQGSTFTSSVLFSGTALDPEDGVLSSSMTWTSSINGLLGTGSSLTRSLSVGSHTITASVTDPDGATRNATAAITVATAPAPWTLSASASTIQVGQSTTLSFTTSTADVTNIRINGQPPTYTCLALSCSGTRVVTPSATTTYTLTSNNSVGTPYPNLTKTVTVTAAPPPPWTFTASPATIQAGQSTVLSFTTTTANFHRVFINGQRPTYSCSASSCSGSLSIAPSATTTYTLVSQKDTGTPYPTVSRVVTVTAP